MICYRCGKEMGDRIGACEDCSLSRGANQVICQTETPQETMKGFVVAARDIFYDPKYGWELTPRFVKRYFNRILCAVVLGVFCFLMKFFIFYEVQVLGDGKVEIETGRLGEFVHGFETSGNGSLQGVRVIMATAHPIDIMGGDYLLPRIDLVYASEANYEKISQHRLEEARLFKDLIKQGNVQDPKEADEAAEILEPLFMMGSLQNYYKNSSVSSLTLLAHDISTLNKLIKANPKFGDLLDISGTRLTYHSPKPEDGLYSNLSNQPYILIESITLNGQLL